MILIASCASSRKEQREEWKERVAEMNESYLRLTQQVSDLDRRLTEIDNSLFIVNDLVDSNSQALKEMKEEMIGLEKGRGDRPGPVSPSVSVPAPVVTNVPAAPEKFDPEIADPYLFYRKSYDYFRSGKIDAAKDSFSRFIRAFPHHELSDNALYWMGECYYAEKDFVTAVKIFERVYREYQGENKAPDALLKLGYTYTSLGEKGKAREVLHRLVREYPRSEAANKARNIINQEG